ncbi:MAG: helix-turn-helix domain-containing protein [Actinomycetota bacterium]
MTRLRKGEEMSQTQYGAELLTVGEVAGIMRVSNMTVYRLIKSGQLPAIRVGKNYRIRRGDIDRYLNDRTVRVETASVEKGI